MFLFDKPFTVQHKPFVYFTIESALDEDISDQLSLEYLDGKEGNSKLWKEFVDLHTSKANEISDLFDESFNLPSDELIPEINFPAHYPSKEILGRDWHIDGLGKKYQIIYYMGDSNITAGEIELASDDTGSNKVTIPFKHNRVIVFHNQVNVSWHRYFLPKNGIRKTWNMPLNYKS